MYRDKDKQKEAQRERARRYRNKHSVTPSVEVTPKIVTPEIVTPEIVTPKIVTPAITPSIKPIYSTGLTCNSFNTLPPDVRQTIDQLNPPDGSEGDGPTNLSRASRIANAIHYQQHIKAG